LDERLFIFLLHCHHTCSELRTAEPHDINVRTYYINLDHRTDRKEYIEKVIHSVHLDEWHKPVRLSPYVPTEEELDHAYTKMRLPEKYTLMMCVYYNFFFLIFNFITNIYRAHNNRVRLKGMYSLFMTHRKLAETVMSDPNIDPDDYIVIFEDDINIKPDFYKVLQRYEALSYDS
jgi:GR25 family glycosyltransferase involved in LPS biosynthesis